LITQQAGVKGNCNCPYSDNTHCFIVSRQDGFPVSYYVLKYFL
jgi:hypothetical protein